MLPKFSSLVDLLQVFHSEEVCIRYLEQRRWKGKVISPFDPNSKVYRCKNGRYFCKNTGKYFNVKTGTIFENTKVPLMKWFVAYWFMSNHKKGISAMQLSKDLHVTRKTAWFMLHRIRECFVISNDIQLEGIVEIDETFVGGKNKNRHWDKKVKQCQGRSFKDKTPIFGMFQRGGNVVVRVVENTQVETLYKEISKTIKKGSTIYTDEWNYGDLNACYTHRNINHKLKIYAYDDVSTNKIENFWSGLKRGIIGVYHYTSRKHLQRYACEFSYRFNHRDLSSSEKFGLYLSNIECRLKYKQLIGKKNGK